MRVALLTNFVPPYRVPLFQALAGKVNALRVFVSTRMEANRNWEVEWGGLDVVEQKTITRERTWRTPSFAEPYQLHIPYDTIAQLYRFQPDVILTGELGARSAQAMLYGKITRTPVVLWATLSDHLEKDRGLARRTLRKTLVSGAHAIIVNGQAGLRYFQRLGTGGKRIIEVPYTTDMKPLLSLPMNRPRPIDFLYVGSLSERKGTHWLIDALNECARAAPSQILAVSVVGDGPLRLEMEKQKVAANLRITWEGSVPYDDLPQHYAKAKTLIFPSLGDEWGLVVNEALAAGVPVLGSSYAQSVEELVRDEVHGWVFTPDGVHSLSATIERVLATAPEQVEQMRVAARERVRALTPDYAASAMAQLLYSVRRQ